MSKPAEIVAECEEMVLDMTLARVRSHCEEQGIKAMGHLPVYTPREIVEAAGMLPVGIVGGGDQVEIIRGDAYFQSYICQIPRSVVELGLGKKLDVLSGMVFPATCDVIRNLSGMWKILFPEQFVYYLDVPHNHDVAVGGKFFAHELKRLGQGLTKISGVEITEEALREAIRKRNENRELVSRLYQLRSDSPEKVPTSELYLLLRAGYLLPLAEHNAMLERYLEATEATDRHVLDNARVIVIGTFCEQPPLGLIRTLERAGCYIVDDDLLLGAHFISAQLETSGDPWLTLARAWFDHARNTPSRYVPNEQKGQYLVELCKERRAEGVIFAAPSFCDPALLEQPMLQAALDRAGIAHTSFKYSENTGQFHAILEQSGTFTDSIKLWSEAS